MGGGDCEALQIKPEERGGDKQVATSTKSQERREGWVVRGAGRPCWSERETQVPALELESGLGPEQSESVLEEPGEVGRGAGQRGSKSHWQGELGTRSRARGAWISDRAAREREQGPGWLPRAEPCTDSTETLRCSGWSGGGREQGPGAALRGVGPPRGVPIPRLRPSRLAEVTEGHSGFFPPPGSPRVGRIVMSAAAKHLTPVTLELGGKNPCYVDDDCDPQTVANRLAWFRYFNTGQTCVAPDYVLCSPDTQERLLPALQSAITRFYGEDPRSSPNLGRIISDKHFQRLRGLLGCGRVAIGGQSDESERYIGEPAVLPRPPVGRPVHEAGPAWAASLGRESGPRGSHLGHESGLRVWARRLPPGPRVWAVRLPPGPQVWAASLGHKSGP